MEGSHYFINTSREDETRPVARDEVGLNRPEEEVEEEEEKEEEEGKEEEQQEEDTEVEQVVDKVE